ncbi:MAG: hypothetical protein BWX58_01673 [Deltaproteobacteria bacterium ADurb.Bin026]|nr:MAG: hypothetical protein BWX58_01673 [Deltaproteobacteria bacterium ADurb.Bin026]
MTTVPAASDKAKANKNQTRSLSKGFLYSDFSITIPNVQPGSLILLNITIFFMPS